MKKLLLAFFAASLSFSVQSQSFTDDFESYASGNMIAATSNVWETWSGPNGGTDDCAVSTANAHSGANSLYFASTAATGGPSDVVLPFPGELVVGQFNLEMWMLVNTAGSGAYFNLQEASNIGTAWAADIYFLQDGTTSFTSGGSELLSFEYPQGAWFKLRMENNLSTNSWEVFLNDISQGVYTNNSTQIASMDIFPLQNNQFYVDDVSYEFTDYAVPALNGAVTGINNILSYLAGQSVTPSVTIRNLGTTAINSFDLDIEYNGTTYTKNITGANIASLAFYTVDFTETFDLVAGEHVAIATISNINGNASDDAIEDDVKSITLNPIVPAAGKVVVAEEGTGTWCQWCPRGAVMMDRLSTHYGEFFAGIAVHNADPMTVDAYDAGLALSSFPGGMVDRGTVMDPSGFEVPFLDRIQVAPKAFINNGAMWDAASRELHVSTSTTFQETVTGNYKILVVLTEDGVTGTGSNWNQSNAYAGGNNGDMGGFESLPNPVPAAQMVYDHVARALSPAFGGVPSAFSGAQNAGNTTTHNFHFVLPAGWDENNMHIISIVVAPDGTIDNAFSSSLSEATESGFEQGINIVSVKELEGPDTQFTVYPVPANNECFVKLNLENVTELAIEIYSTDGKLVVSKDYGTVRGNMLLPVNMSDWNTGMYKMKIITDKGVTVRSLVKE